MNKKKFTYKKSGVNIKAADKFVDFISTVSTKKRGKKKFSNIGGFGSITDIPNYIKKPKSIYELFMINKINITFRFLFLNLV